jgi:multimeric flavodoxin WrbA
MMSPELKALMDRAFYVARANSDMFKRKVGAAVVAVRRAGGIPTFDAINHFFLISQMIVPGSSYWNIGIGSKKGEVENDQEGMETMETLGKNMAWLLKKTNRA